MPSASDEHIKEYWPYLCRFIREYSKVDEQLYSNIAAKDLISLITDEPDAHILKSTSIKPAAPKKSDKKRKNLSGDTPPQKKLIKIDSQINEHVEEKKRIAAQHKKTVQPYMLFVGGPEKFTSFYVIVDDFKYEVDNPLNALKLNFEVFFFGNYKFPESCYNIWIFIQKFLFKTSTVGNKYPAKIKKMNGFIKYEHFFNLPLLSDNMTEQSLSFISDLYNYNDLPRARVQNIIDSCSNFVKNSPLNTFITGLIQRLEDLGERSENLYDFREIQDVLSNPFKDLTSEFRRLEAFKSNGTYVPPQKIKIGEREDYRNSEGVTKLVKIPVTIEYISITVSLKNFLELPNIFESILDYMGTLSDESSIHQNVLKGQLWKVKKKSIGDKLLLPLVLYHDDYETNNPLGSHRGLAKTGAVYINIPCLPPNLQSNLENIFVPLLFNSLDEKDFSYQIILNKLLEELKELQTTGLILFENTPSEKTIFFFIIHCCW
ncbi:Protein of unknown function [Cotesia congregata]|uniref:Uncharacterized protein n=1 Tax=Cotesia congregata TaxID=51543 RepID=A0A8J2EI33_COTCN|nr:Protein of unknown function [Cotesia congregata]